jgi:hypothetical protein
MGSTAIEPVRFRSSRARPGLRIVDMMQGGRRVATIDPTGEGVRPGPHDGRNWAKPRWSAKHPTAVDIDFALDGR